MNVNSSTVMHCRSSIPIITQNTEAINKIAVGQDMWAKDADPVLLRFRQQYLEQYSALPTNTQFVERGVKESGYVSLGKRCESNRTILAIARGKVLPDALNLGREELLKGVNEDVNKDKKCQLKGKRKTMQLMKGIRNHNQDMRRFKQTYSANEYNIKRRRIKESLATTVKQFKKERIEKKVNHVISTYSKNPAPNRFQRQEGYTLTPLMEGKIQYGKMKKLANIDPVRNELRARSVEFETSTGWKALIKLLKEHENESNDNSHEKYFFPLTDYNNFVWNEHG